MSLSPSDILQRLKQLKIWQESQEELLKKTKTLLNTSENVTTASDYQTIEGLSVFDTTNENSPEKPNWEAQVISPTKSFNELLEEKLAQDPGPKNVVQKDKKPFLRKGTGLGRFKMKAQPPKPLRKKKVQRSDSGATALTAPDLSIRPKAIWSKVDDQEEHFHKINRELNEQNLYEKQLEKELKIFEALEQKAANSSFCSTSSSVMRIFEVTPIKKQPSISEEKRVHWESSEEEVIETNLEKEDIAEILLKLKSLAQTKESDIPSVIDASDEEKWSTTTTEPSSDDNSSVTSTELEETLTTLTRDIGVGTTEYSSGSCVICGDELKKTISEYENKIKEVIQDKNRVTEVKKQLEQKERDFLKKKREFEDERQDSIFELETEKKKLAKERLAFQTYMKDSQNRPNKKERQEISNLKQEVADLTETLKLKESKNGMSQARLRNQIKQLEKENLNLKQEVEKLTKENAKLSASQKLNRKSSDSKILQEINKNISKLAQETKKPEEETKKPEVSKKKILLDTEDSFLEMGTNQDIEAEYASTFRNQSTRSDRAERVRKDSYENTLRNQSPRSDRTERVREDGYKEVKYSNGNVKIVSPDGNFITIRYFNGDKQETNLHDGIVRYYFASKNICQTTYADGLEVVEFPEGVVEKRYTDHRCEVTLPDGVVQTTFPDGTQETKYTDGSIVKINPNGEKILILTNGQKEIETKEFKRREYPDGTVKILYPDGTQETKYANGRVRIKDGNGTLILDTQT